MNKPLSLLHKRQLEEIKRDLSANGAKEGSFVKVELLFYKAIAVAREYGDDERENYLLAALKQVQFNQYQQTNALFKKSTQREQSIRRFITSVKSVLATGIRNGFVNPKLSRQ